MLDPEGPIEDVSHDREAVGGAGRIRDHSLRAGQGPVVDSVANRGVGLGGIGREDHPFDAVAEMNFV